MNTATWDPDDPQQRIETALAELKASQETALAKLRTDMEREQARAHTYVTDLKTALSLLTAHVNDMSTTRLVDSVNTAHEEERKEKTLKRRLSQIEDRVKAVEQRFTMPRTETRLVRVVDNVEVALVTVECHDTSNPPA
jgi:hypothetical protein